ncbi:nitrate reductase [Sulfitobacter aestuarii]|uniref:Nitrate reductase n=1 Tax=Sulfitobacter aestuarii TaxID=2161676 RepID=A0ABW5U5U7_9RHOB
MITWVDGADPIHRAKRLRYQNGADIHFDAVASTRFASSGEIRFAVLSILQFCPFIDRIHIVTDDQYPTILRPIINDPAYRDRIRVVNHRSIYGEHADLLPVFSSRSIETMIHRIPDLAPRFIYLNDDIFIGRPLDETYFFEGDRAVLRGRMRRFPNPMMAKLKRWIGRDRPGYGAAQRAAARLAGSTSVYFLAEHQPHPMHRDTLARFYEQDPEALRRQAGHRFRSAEQISPTGLSNHLEIANGAKVAPATDVGYIRPGRPSGEALADVMKRLNSGAYASFCVQSLDVMSESDCALVLSGLERYYAST